MTPLFSGKYTASPCIDPKPQGKKGSLALESASITAQERSDFESQHDLSRDYDTVDEDYLPTLEELLRPTLRKQDSIREPPSTENTLQRADQRSLDGSSGSINQ
jgi:hypothetical protein